MYRYSANEWEGAGLALSRDLAPSNGWVKQNCIYSFNSFFCDFLKFFVSIICFNFLSERRN